MNDDELTTITQVQILDVQQAMRGQTQPAGHRPVRRGETCPRCGIGQLDYNGLIDLECPVCGFTEGPGGGCT
jgi:hypothetical protein